MASKKSNMPIESLPSKGSDTRKKSKTQVSLAHTFGNNAFLLASLRKTHIGKRILLRAKDADCKTATIDFDERCIVEKGEMFQNYPNLGDEDTSIQDYKIEMLNADHELFNAHLGQVNKPENDLRESKKNIEQDEKVRATDDVQDIDDKFHVQKIDGYSILVAEFLPEGTLTDHLIQLGTNAGKMNTKQDWSTFLCTV